MIDMRTWKIAKLLLDNCETQRDVDEVLQTLNDSSEMRDLVTMMSPFASRNYLTTPVAVDSKRRRSSHELKESMGKSKSTTLTDTTKNTTVEQMESLFRSCGMTNKQVEQWFDANFKIRISIGKGSLRNYITRILDEVDLGLSNRILSTIQRQANSGLSDNSDIEKYWDQLDKHFSRPE